VDHVDQNMSWLSTVEGGTGGNISESKVAGNAAVMESTDSITLPKSTVAAAPPTRTAFTDEEWTEPSPAEEADAGVAATPSGAAAAPCGTVAGAGSTEVVAWPEATVCGTSPADAPDALSEPGSGERGESGAPDGSPAGVSGAGGERGPPEGSGAGSDPPPAGSQR
jgi:hypothetical protein